ncbi:MAG: hypothetical protein Q7J35_12640 [Candidatus Methanoperedens sp.]|nr:hypothetical protein [Candidatus Methanoperedens sp.]
MATQPITQTQLEMLRKLGLPEVKENNQWLVLHLKGDGEKAPQSWNAKIYTNSTGKLKLVTTDTAIFATLLDGRQHAQWMTPPAKFEAERVISIDDSGWGFPLLGTLIGLHDSQNNSIHIGEVPVKYYQPPSFERKDYLHIAAHQVVRLLGELQHPNADIFDPRTVDVLFKVCTGYVNTGIVRELRERGFKVEICAIGEPLQSALETAHMNYIREKTRADIYYDPKELDKAEIPKKFGEAVRWIEKNNAWSLTKTGWNYFKARNHP